MASTITGGIKFFEKSKCLAKDGASAEVVSGDVVSDYMLDTNPITSWNSVGSSDIVTETLTIRFGFESEINRILLINHNFKAYTIQYWNGSTYVDFSNVYKLTGTVQSSITETVNANDTSYYEFDTVTTTIIKITITTTQVANDEKYIFQVIATKELGTLEGYPIINSLKQSRNTVVTEMLSGKQNITKGYETFSCKLQFKNYPASLSDDLDLVWTLYDSQDPFLVWLCGGHTTSSYFRYALRGFRPRDIYQCQVKGDVPVSYYKNIYNAPVNLELQLEEHV